MDKNETNLDNFTQEIVKFSVLKIHLFALVVLVASLIIFGLPFYLIRSEYTISIINSIAANTQNNQFNVLGGIIGGFIGLLIATAIMIVHELIHGIFYAYYAKNKWKSVKFGLVLKKGIAYCICTEVIKIRPFFITTIMPTVIMGIVPLIISLINGSLHFFFFGIINMLGGCGDIYIILRFLKESKDSYILDKSNEMCMHIYRRNIL